MNRLIFIAVMSSCISYQTSQATCTAPEGEASTPCIGCGNLEEGQAGLGHDLGWNEYLSNDDLQLEMAATGMTRLHLTNPPFSSAGNLYYTVTLRDTTYRITNTARHSRTTEQYREFQLTGQITGVVPSVSGTVTEGYREHLTNEFGASITRGTDPFESRILNSEGNEIDERERHRMDPPQTPGIPDNSDDPDPQYERSECVDEDPREDTVETPDGLNSEGGRGDGDVPEDSLIDTTPLNFADGVPVVIGGGATGSRIKRDNGLWCGPGTPYRCIYFTQF